MGTYSDLAKSKPTIHHESNPKADSELSSVIKAENSQEKPQIRMTERISERKNERPELNSLSLPYRRRTKRYSFEFYDDQILAIKRLVYKANLSGENISQSDIVRAALDEYLKEEKDDQ